MKFGYSNYGMKSVDVVDALPRIREIGYEAMEVCSRDGWPTAAAVFDTSARRRLVAALKEQDFPPPVLIDGLSVCAEGDERKAMLRRAESTFRLAAELNFGDCPALVTTTVGLPEPEWESGRWAIRDGFLELAGLAASFGVILAAEAHAGNQLATPERAAWLMEQTGHHHLKIDFDISHFVTQGFDVRESVDLLARWSVLTHVKDGRIVNGDVQFLLPGDGDLDLADFLRVAATAGLPEPVYVEVTRQISELPGYDAWGTAEYCYRMLDEARAAAGLAP